MRADSTLVVPYASIETGAPKEPAGSRVLLEAKLVWAGDVLAVTHVKPRDVLRVRDLALDVPGGRDTIVARGAELVLPNGAAVPSGCTMTLRLGRARLRLAFVPDDGEVVPRARSDGRVRLAVLGAAVVHVAVLACLVHGRASDASAEASARESMGAYMAAAEARAQAELAAARQPAESSFPTPGTSGARASSEEGSAGSPSHTNEGMRRIASGDGRRPRAPTEDAVGTFGMISLVAGEGGEKPGTSPWADERGTSARGNLFGETIEDAAGVAGLGLSSAGSGAGERGETVALGAIGTIGRGGGAAVHASIGGHGRLGGGHEVRSPTVSCRCGDRQVNGRLPPESIQRVVRASFGRFRGCYEKGLHMNTALNGRIAVKFVIDRAGQVDVAQATESSLGDAELEKCVVRAFESLAFPQPEGGIVTVVYPLVFTPA